jgi:hypothetical protein
MKLQHGRVYLSANGTLLVALRQHDGAWGLVTLDQFERWQPPRLLVVADGAVVCEGTRQDWGLADLRPTAVALIW